MSGLGNIISQRVKNDDFDERKATIRRVFMAHGFTIKDGQTDLKPYVYEAAEALLRELSPAVAVPDEQPQTGREKWTVGELCEHFGGRHKDENPMNYYEFGSVWAIAKMLDSFAVTQRRVGWNACRAAMLASAAQAQWDQEQGPQHGKRDQ